MGIENDTKNWGNTPVVVLLSVIASLIAIIVFATGKENLPEMLATPTSYVPAETFNLEGVWEGTDPRGVVFRFTFAAKCNIGEVCGKLELPTVGCTAIPVLVSTDGVTYEFDETNHQNCNPDTGNDTIKVLSDGSALYGSNGQAPTIPLHRK